MKAPAQATNQLHAVVTTAPEQLQASLGGLATAAPAERAAWFRPQHPTAAAKVALLTLARPWQRLTDEITDLAGYVDQLTADTAPP